MTTTDPGYIVVNGARSAEEIKAYMYADNTFHTVPWQRGERWAAVVHCPFNVQYQADRYSSGMIGAKVCKNLNEVHSHVLELY